MITNTNTMQKIKFNLIKLIAATALSIFVYRVYNNIIFENSFRPNLVLLLIGEIVTVGVALSAKPAKDYAINFFALISTAVATFYFLFVNLNYAVVLLPAWITGAIQSIAIIWQIIAKLYLGRSFGLMPANRGVVTSGPYKVVRHPIYLGYFINHIGFLLSSFSFYNLALYAALYFFQGIRIWQEEQLLIKDQTYISYTNITKYRLIPWLF